MTTLTMRDEKRIEIIQIVFRGDLTVVQAALLLGISGRQCYRIKRRVHQEGVRGVIHGNRGRRCRRRVKERIVGRVVELARGKYPGFNDHHLTENLITDFSQRLSRRHSVDGQRFSHPWNCRQKKNFQTSKSSGSSRIKAPSAQTASARNESRRRCGPRRCSSILLRPADGKPLCSGNNDWQKWSNPEVLFGSDCHEILAGNLKAIRPLKPAKLLRNFHPDLVSFAVTELREEL